MDEVKETRNQFKTLADGHIVPPPLAKLRYAPGQFGWRLGSYGTRFPANDEDQILFRRLYDVHRRFVVICCNYKLAHRQTPHAPPKTP